MAFPIALEESRLETRSLFDKRGNVGSERGSDLPKVTQQSEGVARVSCLEKVGMC